MFTKIGSLVLVIVVGVIWMAVADDSMDHIGSAILATEASVQKFVLLLLSGMMSYFFMMLLNTIPYVRLILLYEIYLLVCTGLYLFFNVIHLSELTPQDILSSDAIAMHLAASMVSPRWMPIVVSIAMCIALHMHIMASSRMFFVESPNGHMPEILSNINVTPKSSLWFLCVLSILYLFISDMYVLNIFSTFAETVYTMLSVGVFLNFHYNLLNIRRKFWMLLPILPVPISICVFYLEKPFPLSGFGMSIGLTLLGIPFYYIANCLANGILPANIP
uniref:Amino acid transporter transmembrane domain-containing protein n=1 Tax=Anopheles funestus TaxID=62324 RepID=A0A4Y0BEL6_ANOFN